MESLQGPKEHWQCKQSKSYTSYERLLKLSTSHAVSCANYLILQYCLFCAMVLMYGEWSNLSWGNWENPVPVLQIGRKTNFILSEIYTCTYNRQTPELKITKNTTWAWQGQKNLQACYQSGTITITPRDNRDVVVLGQFRHAEVLSCTEFANMFQVHWSV